MWMKYCKKSKIILPVLVLALLFACCALQPGTCLASGTYTVTEQELTTLEDNLTKLEEINQQSQTDLTMLKSQLAKSQQALQQAEEKSQLLEKQLTELKLASRKQENLLQNANLSLQTYAAEEKATRLRIKAQRNAYAGLAVALAIFKH